MHAGGGGGGSSSDLFRISHQSVSGGTYPVEYGANLASSSNMSMFNNVSGPGVENGVRIWNWAHITDGSGWNGRNFLRFYRWSDVNGDPDSGWYFNPGTLIAPQTVQDLSPGPLYIRFRIRVFEYLGAGGNSAGMKWFLFGGPGLADGGQRMIMFIQNGLAYSGAGEELQGAGGSLVGNTCIVMSAGVSGNRAPLLVSNAIWLHVQMAWAYTGAPGGPYMRIYVNNNNINSPNASETLFNADGFGGVWNFPPETGNTGWATGHWADIVSTNSTTDRDAIFDLMDLGFGQSFDSNWYPG